MDDPIDQELPATAEDIESLSRTLLANGDREQLSKLWRLVQRRNRSSTSTDFGDILPEYAWGDLLAVLPGAQPDDVARLYCVVETQKADKTRIALFMISGNLSVSLIEGYDYDHSTAAFDPVFVSKRIRPLVVPLAIARQPRGVLASLLKEFTQYPPAPMYPDLPVGKEEWLSRAMVTLSQATGNLPPDVMAIVHRQVVENDADQEAWFGGRMRISFFEERRLQLLLRLFADRQAARLASPLFGVSGASLVDRAAAVCRGRFDSRRIPVDIVGRAAAYAWHSICTEKPLESGRLPRADDLVAVARALGIDPDPMQRQYPELLCGVLAEPAVVEIARSRYSIEPIPSDAGKMPRNPTACQLWRWTHASRSPPGTRIDKYTGPLVTWLERKDIWMSLQDKADARRFYVRLAAYMVPPLYLDRQ
ncbi:hypothetical protein psal_cds_1062 [Pandoravirus salinus]|uniref:Uncharacterized protein n=1 Tax=Pandoravirus salinus TaxID=1349410 RepID=S4VY21_9VIRU|nr:hypothetical protein psal_cds_1062 [Pandoravirus salinus]AGO85268.1 hypothetical protein psal_cds_1062 [Pandoravirus salinus]